MSRRLPRRWHTAHALVAYIAQNTSLRLCAASLVELVKRRVPGAKDLGEGRVRIDLKVFDIWDCARYKRRGGERGEPVFTEEPTMLEEYEAALKGWTMPECRACGGMARGHSCGPDCQHPLKDVLVWRRHADHDLGPPSCWDSSWKWPPARDEWGGSVRVSEGCWLLPTDLPPPWEASRRSTSSSSSSPCLPPPA